MTETCREKISKEISFFFSLCSNEVMNILQGFESFLFEKIANEF